MVSYSQTTVELLYQNKFRRADQNQLVSLTLSEATRIRSIGHQLMIQYTGEGIGLGEGR